MSAHAYLAPSDWEGWSHCAGKPALEEGEPEQQSEAGARGTHGHELAARRLRGEPPMPMPADLEEPVNAYIEKVRDRLRAYEVTGATSVALHVEQRLNVEPITGERGAHGTADAIIIAEYGGEGTEHSVLEVIDAKFGYLEVDEEGNGQLGIYALAAVLKYSMLHNITEVRASIFQPAHGEFLKPHVWTLDALYEFGQTVTEKAAVALSLRGEAAAVSHLAAGKWCRFCRAAYRCPELQKQVTADVFGDFQDLTPLLPADRAITPAQIPDLLGYAMARVPLIERWCLAVRAEVERRLLASEAIPGFKLVMGRAGPRRWKDAETAERLLIADGASPDKIFSPRKLLSPTQVEKNLGKKAPVLGVLKPYIEQSEGQPSVAPITDDRPAYAPQVTMDFDTYNAEDLV